MPPYPAFTLRIFESEYKEIENLVLRFENIETGGDLFGLWTRDTQPVIQFIIGPGQQCRRTSVSFHQDVNYLGDIGGFLNTSFMLCHIGSWHSHHQLSLTHPSVGDHSTVRNNFPAGLERYIMIIANIVSNARSGRMSVELHPYMFSCEGVICDDGQVEVIPCSSPFRDLARVVDKIIVGAEKLPHASRNENSNYSRVKQPAGNQHVEYGQGSSNKRYEKSLSVETLKRDPKPEDVIGQQWYSSPAGKEKLTKIHAEILEMIENEYSARVKQSDKVQFTRHPKSLDLMLEFLYCGRQWNIEFPNSFNGENVRISYSFQNSQKSYRSEPFLSAGNIIGSIQYLCHCARHEMSINRGSEIETGHEDGAVKIESDEQSWEEPMCVDDGEDHGPRSSTPIENETVNQESREDNSDTREHRELASISSHEESLNITETAEDGNRPQHQTSLGTNGGNTSDSKTEIQQWYESDQGAEKLRMIRNHILSNLKPISEVEFSREKESRNLTMLFLHNHRNWVIQFPRSYDEVGARIEYTRTEDSQNARRLESSGHVISKDIVDDVQKLCPCENCGLVEKYAEEITTHCCQGLGRDLEKDEGHIVRNVVHGNIDLEKTTTTTATYTAPTSYPTELEQSSVYDAERDRENKPAASLITSSEAESKESEVSLSPINSPISKESDVSSSPINSPGSKESEVSFSPINSPGSKESEVSCSPINSSDDRKSRKRRTETSRRRRIIFTQHANKSQHEKLVSNEGITHIKLKKSSKVQSSFYPLHRRRERSITEKTTGNYTKNLFETSCGSVPYVEHSSHSAYNDGTATTDQNITERSTPRKSDNSDSSFSSVSPSKSKGTRGKRQQQSFARKGERSSIGGASTSQSEERRILGEVISFIRSSESQRSIYIPGKSFQFYHGQIKWIIDFRKNFPRTPAKLYTIENSSRSFCGDIWSINVLNLMKVSCKCKRCGVAECKTRKSPYPNRVPSRKFRD